MSDKVNNVLKSTTKFIRWGIIGCGQVSHRFMNGLNDVPNSQLVAAWSKSPSSIKSFVDKYGGKACLTLEELLTSDVDAIYVATLPDSHTFYSIAALKAGKHVLCEKPAAVNLMDLNQMLEEAKAQNLLFMEAMKPPFFPLYQQLKKHIVSDPIGEVGYVRAGSSVTGIDADHPSFSPELVGGSLMAIGIYEAFLAVDWLGDLTNVQAMGRIGKTGVDVFSVFQTEYAKGFGQFYTGFEVHGKGDALICGSIGNITIQENWWNPASATINYTDGRIVKLDIPIKAGGFNYEISHFCELIMRGAGESPILSHDMSRKMISIIDKARVLLGLKFPGEQ